MKVLNASRRSFLKMGSLLTVGIALTPTMAIFSNHESHIDHSDVTMRHNILPTRSDIRSLDFDSHNFLLNFRD